MSSLLRIAGALAAVWSFILGFYLIGDSFLICIGICLSGFIELLVLFAIAQHLDNQDNIVWMLRNIDSHMDTQNKHAAGIGAKIKCESCGHSYESDRTSCPYCGQQQ